MYSWKDGMLQYKIMRFWRWKHQKMRRLRKLCWKLNHNLGNKEGKMEKKWRIRRDVYKGKGNSYILQLQ